MQQIIAMGGGGFMMEPDNLALDQYVLKQTATDHPRISFLGQASAEHPDVLIAFYKAFTSLGAQPSHLSLFKPHTADLADYLLSQNAIYVGGGNTKSMLALWREWGVDQILKQALEQGIVLAGLSAGAICWFEQGTTDSIPGGLRALPCLGFLPGSCSPHYDGEAERRPTYHRLLLGNEIKAGYAFDDGAAGHFVNGELHTAVTSRPYAKGYRVEVIEDGVKEVALDMRYLGGA